MISIPPGYGPSIWAPTICFPRVQTFFLTAGFPGRCASAITRYDGYGVNEDGCGRRYTLDGKNFSAKVNKQITAEIFSAKVKLRGNT